jgi:hypothetical protein
MSGAKSSIAVPVLIIAVGIGWLLTVWDVLPSVNWVWLLCLGIVGVLALASGIDKLTFVVGPFLIVASFFSLLRQTERITVEVEVPSLVITGGVLMLLAALLPLRTPRWLIEPQGK